MRELILLVCISFLCLGFCDGQELKANGRKSPLRDGKLFTLFNVIQFQNEGCRSNSRTSGAASGATHRNGTCFTSSECRDKGGSAAGSCAAGFGVCCVFIISKSGKTADNNCTYIQNPNYPNTYDETSTVSYSINKCSDDVCSIRMDFESFTIKGTADTTEVQPLAACDDTFSVETITGFQVPTICGRNTGQHMYIDIGRQPSDTISLTFSFTGESNIRSWEIKVSQIKCTDELLPPEGCLQYHVSTNGRFETFNFMSSDETHPPEMDYNVCIRQEQGMCCIRYQICPDTDAFTLDTLPNAVPDVAAIDSECTDDYIRIEDSGQHCARAHHQFQSHNKYCGRALNYQSTAAANPTNAPICDCSTPFMVGIKANILTDTGDTATPNTHLSRGACLTFDQVAC